MLSAERLSLTGIVNGWYDLKSMIRKKFLESLVGMNIYEAEKFCRSLGHGVHRLPPGVSGAPAIAAPNTVVLWPAIDKDKENQVRYAAAGDPLEVSDQ